MSWINTDLTALPATHEAIISQNSHGLYCSIVFNRSCKELLINGLLGKNLVANEAYPLGSMPTGVVFENYVSGTEFNTGVVCSVFYQDNMWYLVTRANIPYNTNFKLTIVSIY